MSRYKCLVDNVRFMSTQKDVFADLVPLVVRCVGIFLSFGIRQIFKKRFLIHGPLHILSSVKLGSSHDIGNGFFCKGLQLRKRYFLYFNHHFFLSRLLMIMIATLRF